MNRLTTRRQWLGHAGRITSAVLAGAVACPATAADDGSLRAKTFDFILRCRREDGGYAPSPDRAYKGNSDTGLSDLAAVTYAAVLAKTFGWELPHAERSAEFVHKHQQPDGSFVNRGGRHDPKADLGLLYNTTQAVVALRALGQKPRKDPSGVIPRFFEKGAYRKLPWYTTSFFPLFYAALDRPFPGEYRKALADHMEKNQKEDGYLGNHVAATFHMAHFFRLIGRPTPRGDAMVQRTLTDQKADGGFGHFPGWHSDMDAVYFQLGALIQAGRVPGVRKDLPDAHTLGWGHAMQPGRDYTK